MKHHKQMQESIELCGQCRDRCKDILVNYCLEQQGEHTEAGHVKTMLDCIQVCQIAADFMRRNSDFSYALCIACAQVCEACAKSCAEFKNDEQMQRCAQICRQCADSCYGMSRMQNVA
jgi:hypothetical protein